MTANKINYWFPGNYEFDSIKNIRNTCVIYSTPIGFFKNIYFIIAISRSSRIFLKY